MNSSAVIQMLSLLLLLLLLFLRLNLLNAITVPMPHTLLLPQGFDPPAAPRQRMHYPISVSTEILPKLLKIPTETPDWQPLTVPLRNLKLPLASAWSTYAPTTPLNGQNKDLSLTNLSVNENPIFESIVYGAWKSNPPIKMFNSSEMMMDDKFFHRTINRQNAGPDYKSSQKEKENLALFSKRFLCKKLLPAAFYSGFIGHFMQKLAKSEKQNLFKPTYYERSVESKSPKLAERSDKQQPIEQKQWLTKKPGRYKIPTIERRTIRDDQENPITDIVYSMKINTIYTTEVIPSTQDKPHETTIKLTTTTTTTTNMPTSDIHLTTITDTKFMKTTNASTLNWPKDFMDTLLPSTIKNLSNEPLSSTEEYSTMLRMSSESPLALSALNIPPSLWPQLPGNITKLGKPYERRSSSEEPALCVPITISEPNISNPRKLISVERVYCFPLPNSTNKMDDFVTKKHITNGYK
uniref:Uncharacterized protein n=1 Tax=Glossina brevipalpis TaxID=37001 RepID=A0A1A9X4I7_9MUSC